MGIDSMKTISTEEAINTFTENELGTVTKPTIITWIRKFKLGKKIGGRWRISEEKYLKFIGVSERY